MDILSPAKRLITGIILLAIVQVCAFTQSPEFNYLVTRVPQVKVRDTNSLDQYDANEILRSVSYFDGLGRLLQEIQIENSPNRNDLISFFDYDKKGRQVREYLPYVAGSSKGEIHQEPILEQQKFFESPPENIAPTSNPFSENRFDQSPLDRIVANGSPGKPWRINGEHPVTTYHGTNPKPVPRWIQSTDYSISSNGSYPEHSLYMVEVTDENGFVLTEYMDKMGKLIMKETDIEDGKAQTFYVFDTKDRLVGILPPMAVSGGILKLEYIYSYRYDDRDRVVEKFLPGMEPIYIVYNNMNLPVLVQDGNQRAENRWLFSKYDADRRIVISGIYEDVLARSRKQLQEVADNDYYISYEEWDSVDRDYTGRTFPGKEITPLNYFYYDGYGFVQNDLHKFMPAEGFVEEKSDLVKERVTGSKTMVLNAGVQQWLVTVNYYSKRGRLIQQVSENHLGGTDRTTTDYDFPGRPIHTLNEHSGDEALLTLIEGWCEYDHAGREIKYWHKINNQEKVLLRENNYNELGQLVEKNIHGRDNGSFLQSLDYRYNIRGWLTQINDPDDLAIDGDLFALSLSYESPENGLSPEGQYNGNISSMQWSTKGSGSKTGYGYQYDAMNRLTGADYKHFVGSWQILDEDYSVPYIGYDLNGNLDSLARLGCIEKNVYDTIDRLEYFYKGNQLIAVDDMGYPTSEGGDFSDNGSRYAGADSLPEYAYDRNGNLVYDANRGILLIEYNHLNLPEAIYFENNNTMLFGYDASGRKLWREVYNAGIIEEGYIDYCGDYVYRADTLAYIRHDEGLLLAGNRRYEYEYWLTDHLGSIRVAFRESSGAAVINNQSHYYPFGLRHNQGEYAGEDTMPYLFNGKELQTDFQLGWYDYGARFYDPQVGRWHSPDPLAEDYLDLSPYSYAANNPLYYIDPTGMFLDDFYIDKNTGSFSRVETGAENRYFTFGETQRVEGGWVQLANEITFGDAIKLMVDNPKLYMSAIASSPSEYSKGRIINARARHSANQAGEMVLAGMAATTGAIIGAAEIVPVAEAVGPYARMAVNTGKHTLSNAKSIYNNLGTELYVRGNYGFNFAKEELFSKGTRAFVKYAPRSLKNFVKKHNIHKYLKSIRNTDQYPMNLKNISDISEKLLRAVLR